MVLRFGGNLGIWPRGAVGLGSRNPFNTCPKKDLILACKGYSIRILIHRYAFECLNVLKRRGCSLLGMLSMMLSKHFPQTCYKSTDIKQDERMMIKSLVSS